MKKILVIAAHPDDEILGCGGVMAKHSKDGDKVYSAILAEGITSRDLQRNKEAHEDNFKILYKAAELANEIVGVTELKLLGFPDNRMDSVDLLDIVKQVEILIEKIKPDIIYTHHIGDVNIDHQMIHKAVITATRPIPGNHLVEEILFFETASSTEWMTPGTATPFTPNYYVNIEETLHLKLKALEAYEYEMRDWPHARSIKALDYLAKWRGANIGFEAAEAFILGRKIVK
ncbi:PIG-L family deacetylase [Lysinibacillus capsici]|uniref:PIG-L deacetylase family protein n=1 Tax=Lysinibacillus capsici TaxID=2115968 RepID=UPI0028EE4FBA|nr:PIG-L family deacetylase [Lysinibacillus capsici]MED3800264.1 PIG-L family deacetylase [Lysinibacillus capsici]